METLLDSKTLKAYEEETNEYIRKKKIKKLFDIILKNVLKNRPENIFLYIYDNIYSFLLNKIFIIGPPLLKITSLLSSSIAKTFDYYHISVSKLIKSHISHNKKKVEEKLANKNLINDDLVSSIIKSTLNNLDAKKKKGYVVEGFPSTNLQANNCLQYLPSHVFVLFADEKYIYEKYEEENDVNIFSNLNDKTDDSPEVFEVKGIDPISLKDKVKVYLRSVSGVLEVLENNKEVINLRDYNEDNLIEHVTNLVRQNKDEWDSVLGED